MKVWLQYLGHAVRPAFLHNLSEVLSQASLETTSPGQWPSKGPGLAVLDDDIDSAIAGLQDLCTHCRNRVLALALSSEILDGTASWQLLAAGADDVMLWTGDTACAQHIAARFERWDRIASALDSAEVRGNAVGKSTAWNRTLSQVVEAALFSAAPVLLTGETGTGKDLIARLIHRLDPRPAKREMVVVDCTTIVPDLAGSELFGHERGAFTGAVASREGAFALANGGTLFLDEVGELSLPLQAQLLRVMQEQTYKRVGGNTWHATSFRLVAATNRNLPALVESGGFRRDLYYRIAAITIGLPALRERREDVPLLAAHFVRQISGGRLDPQFVPPVERWLVEQDYPGNVRDLRQLISRLLYRHSGRGPITAGLLVEEERPVIDVGVPRRPPASLRDGVLAAILGGASLKEVTTSAANAAIELALEQENGNLQRAAKRLGVTDRALQLRRAQQRAESA